MKIALMESSVPGKQDRVFYPLGIGYCASYVQNLYPDCEVTICSTLEELMEAGPDLAGISATSPAWPEAARNAALIRQELSIPVILGGAHISSLPGSLTPVFDAAVIGEGEAVFASLAGIVREGGTLSAENLVNLKGVAFCKGPHVVVTTAAPPIENLDILPFPMRRWKGSDSPAQWLFSSRGCPFSCIFCASSTIWKGYRAHSPEYVAREVSELIKAFGLRFCIFMDDLFAVDLKRIKALSELMRTAAPGPLALTVTLRADNASQEMCRHLSDMGVAFVHMGLESGSEKILRAMKCGTTDVKTNEKALIACHEEGLNAIGSFIIGAPGEDEDDLDATYRFIVQHLKQGTMKGFSFSPLVPFPGTAVWHSACSSGLIDSSAVDWESLDLDIRHFTGERYILLTDRMNRQRFMYHFERFRSLFEETAGIKEP